MSKVAGIPPKRALPSKEAGLFKEVLTLYETRQLKKGLKTADFILKKFPEHGETMCMKGLILAHMGRREEGINMVKKGVRFDLTSHICWHVFGLIQKGEKNYEEALKSYMQALKFDKENMNILRDSAQLQTQLRLFENLVETRYTLLRLRPNLRQNWVALSVAHYLNGNVTEAKKVLEHYEKTLKNVPDNDVEHSECLLYYVKLMEESGEPQEALDFLDNNRRAILDKTAISEIRARLLTKLKSDAAESAWSALFKRNAECSDYYSEYLEFRGLSLEGNSPEALAVLQTLADAHPRANAPKRLSLSVSTGETFTQLAEPYLVRGLERGVPSLFADLKSLYKDDTKKDAIEKLLESALERFKKDSAPEGSTEPTTYLWTLYFLAQHHSYLGRQKQALSILDQAIEHTPTLPDLHLFRARILKRAGDYLGAATSTNDARTLDGQDRFLNTKCGKYLLRAGMIEEASSVFGLFTKKDAASPGADLEEMQSLLYILEEGHAHELNGKPNLALKKYFATKKIFDEIEDDQYDFHGYNLRKFTITIYLKMLKWEDTLFSHPAYVKAAISASRILVSVHDDPSIVTALSAIAPLTDAEKKAKKKAKKAAAAAKPTDDKKGGAANEDKGLDIPVTKDEDSDGLKLLGCSDPLERAFQLLRPIINVAPSNLQVWLALYDVQIRRKKLLQAAAALHHAKQLSPESPGLHLRIVDLKHRASKLPQAPPAPIGPVFSEAVAKLDPGSIAPATFNSQYLQLHASDPEAIFACAQALHAIESPLDEVENAVFTLLADPVALDTKMARSVLRFLTSIKSTRAEEFRAACDKKFELSTLFKTPEELATLRKKVLNPKDAPLTGSKEAKKEEVTP
ncbi:N-terminal acetyltransferase A, auxiliary subunit [Coprinopsis marcescibilis]|uniref:N-terminal acetyltransferase A, auxiliary subunit n=1 Tax=Coprinopsis marcescibilis TaxID=230819 RepID=A0A5C3KL23_COPMA|nr:N-terminal acetyltransferase A, auxiliary subunit [Coprinopsis marcescibilis]